MKPKKNTPPPKLATNVRAASASLGVPVAWIERARNAGCEGFSAKGGIQLDPVRDWIKAHAEELEKSSDALPVKEQIQVEKLREIRMKNDVKAGTLVQKSWVVERWQRCAGEINGIRARSEAEDPLLYAATNGDVNQCRSVTRAMWDRSMKAFQDCGKHFEE